jgi:hypothetical protein
VVELRAVPSGGDRPASPSAAIGGPASDELLERLLRDLPRPARWLMAGTAVLAGVQLVIVLPWLVGSDPWDLLSDSSAAHTTRDGSLGLVIAAAALLTVWRARWALPCFLVASLALVAQAVAGLVDTGSVMSDATAEIIHLPSVVLTCLIGLAAVPLTALGPRRRRPG